MLFEANSMNEEFKGAICLTGYIDTFYDLYFTSKRVIVAKTGTPYGLALTLPVVGYMVEEHNREKKSKEYKELPFDDILKGDKKNFEIPFSEISKIEMKKPGLIVGTKIIFYTKDKKMVFYIKEKGAYAEHVTIVSSVLKDKLTLI